MRLFLAGIPYTKGLPAQLASSLIWNAQRGVQVFFAASGFLITSPSLRRWGLLSRIRVRDFYALRFARIAPLLLFTAVVIISGLLGGVVARYYSEPMNRRIRRRFGDGPGRFGSAR
jgi:peptidoglycan/LPS O-acetylase OafA/YrhL